MSPKYLLLGVATLTLMACSGNEAPKEADVTTETVETLAEMTEIVETLEEVAEQALSLDAVLDMQPEDMKARYQYRNPKATLEYFDIQPGMTVAEVLPGGGWYSKILLPYIGNEGKLIGVDYSVPMWGKFGGFANDEFLETRKSWSTTWSEGAMEWRGNTQADITAFPFGAMPRSLRGTADRVLMFRATHHLNRFEAAYWDEALADIKALLKPDGMVGIVQHRAPEASADDWAAGDNGYVKQSFVIAKFEEAGFVLAKEPSEINGNSKDTPTSEDGVWRLPPTLGTSRENPELKAKMEAIGESDRMTLLFKLK